MSVRAIEATFLGRIGYKDAFDLQDETRDRVREQRGCGEVVGAGAERFYLLEHPPVFTLGRNADPEDIRASQEWLDEHEVTVEETDRGGQVTYHGPGQLVGYPVVDLAPDRRDLRRYVHDLQEVLVRVLASFGVEATAPTQQSEIGVWVGDDKIASIGVHVSRWITTHGFALNVSTDLSHFAGIVACGLPNVRMTSIEQLIGEAPPLEDVARCAADAFAEVFERPLEWRPFETSRDALGEGSRTDRPSEPPSIV